MIAGSHSGTAAVVNNGRNNTLRCGFNQVVPMLDRRGFASITYHSRVLVGRVITRMSVRLHECTDQEAQQIQLVADAKSRARTQVTVQPCCVRRVSSRQPVVLWREVFRGHRV